MATRNDLFPSKYIKHADLNGKEVTVTIADLTIEEVGMDREEKPVISFKDARKSMVLNMTNYDAIAEVYGEETDAWAGKQITLYPDKARFGGKVVDAVRVKVPGAATAAEKADKLQAPVTEDEQFVDDAIPF